MPVFAWLLAALLSFVPLASSAQTFPTKPIHIVIGFPPGTATDTVARLLAERIQQAAGWTIVIDNRIGQSGSLAAADVARAAPDGYTLLLAANGPLATNPALYTNVRYDTLRDFVAVAPLVSLPYVLVVNAASRYATLQDVVAAAKAAPKSLNYSTPGSGTTSHLITALFAKQANVELTHVPYKGSAESLNGMLAGSIDLLFETTVVTLPLIKGGKLRPLAVTSGKRIDSLPDVPTLQEAGVPLDIGAWLGVVAPAHLPPAVTRQLNAQFMDALNDPAMKEKLVRLGAVLMPGSPEDFATFLKGETVKWGQAVRDSNARVE